MFSERIQSTEQLLEEFCRIDFGYPLGDNLIRSASSQDDVREILKAHGYTRDDQLTDFFRSCDGISWPDVNRGYFVEPLASIEKQFSESMPRSITGSSDRTIIQIGSNGGGNLFAADCATGAILLLPTGRIVDNVYDDSDGRVRKVAGNMVQFAERLARDLKAFVDDATDYEYLA